MKGYVYTIEVMLAVSVVIMTAVFVFGSTPEQAETGLALIKQNGYDALFYLDSNGDLRDSVSRNATGEILSNLSSLLPASIAFDAVICEKECTSAGLPDNRTIITADYYVGGYREGFAGKKVRLWMWEQF